MAKTNEDLLRRPLYVYDLPAEVLDTLVLKADADAEAEAIAAAKSANSSPSDSPSASDTNLVGTQACSLCGLTFTTVIDQRGHLKSDLHHYNLKQKLRGQKAVSEAEFEKLVGDLDESLSGSDSDESEEEEEDGRQESTLTALLKRQARLADKGSDANGDEGEEETAGRAGRGKPPLIWFSSPTLPEKTYFGMYRAIMTGEEQRNQDLVEVLRKKQVEPISMPKIPKEGGALPEVAYKGPHIFLCMIGGGHFAAMIVSLAPRPNKNGTTMNREATVLAHKTFHRYTTRRKQGGSQSANDNAKGAAHSAGSSLRRYNEQALVDDVRNLLQDWKALIDTSELLFIRATGVTNRRTLYGPYEGQVLKHNDTRLRGFPFSTRRATQNELMRSFIELTRLKVREIIPVQETKKEESATPTKTASKPSKPKLSEEEETALLHTSQLQAFVRRSKVPALLSYLKNNSIAPDFEFQPLEQNYHAPRPLHLAAAQNAAPLVLGLLARGGADPTIKNNEGKTPFELAGERSTRDAFRVARSELGEAKWSWDEAKVPSPMTKAEADKRDEREKKEATDKETERRRAEEERLKSEGPKVPEGRKQKGNTLSAGLKQTPQEKREAEARGLTPEMRMRLERERRARAAEERLKKMQGGG
ncbi:hypothetical protein FSARC_4244 [Fusarium sarcochroum]|uniref:VLRF1 domain-containing protein n=1 Tax=Fusarium sarcochroum TaxID=1208366 RepID=A0A8H4XBP0_9HYPO|nr:hypothetical protein FSARC_4244 [Fusarium sarcochroum]